MEEPMATTREELSNWFDEGVKKGATHMIVVCDTFDWGDYPVYVKPGQNVRELVDEYPQSCDRPGPPKENTRHEMQKVMEVYDLWKDRDEQINSKGRVFNY